MDVIHLQFGDLPTVIVAINEKFVAVHNVESDQSAGRQGDILRHNKLCKQKSTSQSTANSLLV